MENKTSKSVYLESYEDMPSIFEKLSECDASEVVLMVPKNALLMRNVANLKMLKKKAEELNKNISIVTVENESAIGTAVPVFERDDGSAPSGTNSLHQAENPSPSPTVNPPAVAPSAPPQVENIINEEGKNKVKMFDIVRKIDSADADNRPEGRAMSFERLKPQKPEGAAERMTSAMAGNQPYLTQNYANAQRKKISLLPSISSKFFAGFILVCLLTAGAVMAFTLPKADISIVLKSESMTEQFDAVADPSIQQVDASQNKIPAKKVEAESEESGSYPTTGKKHVTSKASGKITVYNEYSSAPQKIVATTRFLSKDGYIFRTAEAITIPGFTRVEGKDIPGEVTVMVYADKAGDKYNIGASSFTLPALQGTAKYSTIYARSVQAMAGGADKEVAYFSESDYVTAKDKLTKTLKDKNEQVFLGKTTDQDVMLDGTKQEEDVKVKTDVKMGDAADNFQMTVSVKTSALFVAKGDLESIAGDKIISKIGADKELLKDGRKTDITGVNKDKDGNVTVSISAAQNSVTKLDVDKVKNEILGKNEEELSRYFNDSSGIKSVNVNFWPFWVKNIPSSPDKTNITIDTNNTI